MTAVVKLHSICPHPNPLPEGEGVQCCFTIAEFYNKKKRVHPWTRKLSALKNIKDIKREADADGSTRYTDGSFTDYKQAQNFKEEIVKKYGLTDAFIIAYNLNQIIPVKQALEVINK